jgi:hypothetical protein
MGHFRSPTPNTGVWQVPHAPAAQVWVPQAGQACVAAFTHWHPSLAEPLQLLSLPGSQVSFAAGATEPLHGPHALVCLSLANPQVREPGLQGPFPSYPAWAEQAWLSPGTHWQTVSIALSGEPSQSLSALELQSRGFAKMALAHGPQIELAHVCLPRLQMPTSADGPQGWVVPSTHGQF